MPCCARTGMTPPSRTSTQATLESSLARGVPTEIPDTGRSWRGGVCLSSPAEYAEGAWYSAASAAVAPCYSSTDWRRTGILLRSCCPPAALNAHRDHLKNWGPSPSTREPPESGWYWLSHPIAHSDTVRQCDSWESRSAAEWKTVDWGHTRPRTSATAGPYSPSRIAPSSAWGWRSAPHHTPPFPEHRSALESDASRWFGPARLAPKTTDLLRGIAGRSPARSPDPPTDDQRAAKQVSWSHRLAKQHMAQ